MNAYTLVSPLFSISEHTEPYKNLSFVSKIIFIIVNHNSPWGPWFGKSNCKKKKWKYFLSLFAFCFHIPLMNEWAQQTVTCDGACACACKFRGRGEVSSELLISFKIIWANSEVHTILHQALNLLRLVHTTQQIIWAPFPILCIAPLPQGGSFYPRLSWPVEHSVPARPSMPGREPALLPDLWGLVNDH